MVAVVRIGPGHDPDIDRHESSSRMAVALLQSDGDVWIEIKEAPDHRHRHLRHIEPDPHQSGTAILKLVDTGQDFVELLDRWPGLIENPQTGISQLKWLASVKNPDAQPFFQTRNPKQYARLAHTSTGGLGKTAHLRDGNDGSEVRDVQPCVR